MVRMVFVDTAYFLALVNERDSFHAQALQLENQDLGWRYTTEWVLTEVANDLCPTSRRYKFNQLMTRLRSRPDMKIVRVKPEQFKEGSELYVKRADKGWSLTDCISFLVMRELGIRAALTPDEDFEQAGFERLMEPRPRGVSEEPLEYGAARVCGGSAHTLGAVAGQQAGADRVAEHAGEEVGREKDLEDREGCGEQQGFRDEAATIDERAHAFEHV